MRTLASIRTIRQILPIEQADLIELAKIDGWQCVVKKGEFKTGDLAVYFEIDSFLPAEDGRFSFLEKNFINFNNKRGARIRTLTLRKQLSQGLALPVSLFPEINQPTVGMDVTDLLKISKWEAPIPVELAGQVIGELPYFIKKTDEERIQNLVAVLPEEIAGKKFEKTIKLDGTSMTIFWHENQIGVCGRNWQLKESESNLLWRVAKEKKIIAALEAIKQSLAFQGELIGPEIQGNHEKLPAHDFYLFNVWDINKQKYFSARERQDLINKLDLLGFNIKQVPSEGYIDFSADITVEEILKMAEGKSLWAQEREGLVFKRADGIFSFKAIANSYLKKHADR